MWDISGFELGTDYARGLLVALAHVNLNVRQAAAEGIAAAMYEHPTTVQVRWVVFQLQFVMAGNQIILVISCMNH